MTAASTPPSSIRTMASSGVKAVTCRCERLLGKPLPQRWIWASTICIAFPPCISANVPCSARRSPSPGRRKGRIQPRISAVPHKDERDDAEACGEHDIKGGHNGPPLGQLLGHMEPRVARRLTIDPRGDLPTLFLVEAGRLKVE